MSLPYKAGNLKALEKVGLSATQTAVRRFIHNNPNATVGGIIGTGLGLGTLLSNEEPSPKMRRPYLEGNPLNYQPRS